MTRDLEIIGGIFVVARGIKTVIIIVTVQLLGVEGVESYPQGGKGVGEVQCAREK